MVADVSARFEEERREFSEVLIYFEFQSCTEQLLPSADGNLTGCVIQAEFQ